MFKLTESPALYNGDFHSPLCRLTLLPNLARLSLAPMNGELGRTREFFQKVGIELPGPTDAVLSPCLILPLGRGQWLLQGEWPDLEPINELICTTDQSDAWCGFQLAGSGGPAVLERLVAAAPQSYSCGRAVRTQIEHLGCWVVGLDNNEWQILGPRSSAESLFVALKHAALAVDALLQN
ncbi:MAG TPA: hypothetical protein VLA39_08145 [Marinobacterium sp.]|nr:hypothetical protein [Marinobacterium sp.]